MLIDKNFTNRKIVPLSWSYGDWVIMNKDGLFVAVYKMTHILDIKRLELDNMNESKSSDDNYTCLDISSILINIHAFEFKALM